MSQQVKVLLAVLVGGGLGGALAMALLRANREADEPREEPVVRVEPPAPPQDGPKPDNGAPVKPPPPPVQPTQPGDQRSFYFRHLRQSIAIDLMTPLLLTPLEEEHIDADCPDRLAVVTSAKTYREQVGPYVEALGPIAFPEAGKGVAKDVLAHVKGTWGTIRAVAGGPVGTPPLRVLVKHYPRPELPGRCFTVNTTFYTVADLYFDKGVKERHAANPMAGPPVQGVLFVVHRTYQLAGERPKVVEAIVEAHPFVRVLDPRLAPARLLGDAFGPFAQDGGFASHFEVYGGGRRYGLAWVDRSAGLGAPDPWHGAYQMTYEKFGETPQAQKAALPDDVATALREFVARA